MDYKYYITRLENKHMVNQSHDDEVLVYNIRRALPININKDVFERFLDKLSPEDQSFISCFYHPGNKINDEGISIETYQLHSVCYYILKDEFETVKNNQQLNKNDKSWLENNYKCVGDYYYLNREYEDFADIMVNKLFNRFDLYLHGDDNFKKLSDILENADEIEKPEIFFGRMFININHPYFYRKDYEHIPGMMIIETARQFGYAVAYKFLGVKMNEVIFSLSDLKIQFKEYIQSNMPVYLKAVNDSIDKDTTKLNRKLGLNVSFFQKGKEMAYIDIYATTIKKEIFERLRKGYDDDYSSRFKPSSKFYDIGYFINIYTQKKYKGQINEISLQGLQVDFKNAVDLHDEDRFEFFMYIDTIGIIQGICILTGHKTEPTGIMADFSFEVMDPSDKENLKEAIKKYTYLLES